jgi:hypothetical protein
MDRKVSFSGQQLNLNEIAAHFNVVDMALRGLYANSKIPRFVGYSMREIEEELEMRLFEEEQMVALSVLAAIEAAFRVDYLRRVYERKKDFLSKDFRQIYNSKGARASLEEDIFGCWLRNTDISSQLIADLRAAFKFRHWLAHGRYWNPKLGRKFDYFNLHTLAQQAANAVPALLF